jgi:hypothetical protein
MATSEERMQILKMVADGKISAAEGAKLLKALEEGSRPKPPPTPEPRWFKVQITDLTSGKDKVNISIPMGLVNAGIKMGARFTPEMEGVNFDEVVAAIKGGAHGRIVDMTDEAEGERVIIYVE